VAVNFPDECLYVLQILHDVYTNDALAKDQGLSAEQRLHFHQENSGPKMDALKAWLTAQIEERTCHGSQLTPHWRNSKTSASQCSQFLGSGELDEIEGHL
jgi:hypothetical protein